MECCHCEVHCRAAEFRRQYEQAEFKRLTKMSHKELILVLRSWLGVNLVTWLLSRWAVNSHWYKLKWNLGISWVLSLTVHHDSQNYLIYSTRQSTADDIAGFESNDSPVIAQDQQWLSHLTCQWLSWTVDFPVYSHTMSHLLLSITIFLPPLRRLCVQHLALIC